MSTTLGQNLPRVRGIAAILLLATIAAPGLVRGQTPQPKTPVAGGAEAAGPRFRVVRSVAGSRGHQDGSLYVVEDSRTDFFLPEDKQVIVYFEWNGPTGPHHLEGHWKTPEGKIASLADFKYEAKTRRFGAYWTFLLTETMAPGLWTLDALIDGESAGSHTVQIVAAPKPPGVEGPPVRRALTPGEVYDRATGAVVVVENLGPKKERRWVASGFVLAADQVITSFEAIEGASSLGIVAPDGKRLTCDGVLSWNRKEDWAVLGVPGVVATSLARSAPDSWHVGDRCHGLDSRPEGSHTIATGTIVGKRADAMWGERIHTSLNVSNEASGSPVLDEWGDVVALVAEQLVPQGTRGVFLPGRSLEALRLTGGAGLAVPIVRVSTPPAGVPATPLETLHRNGDFLPPITASGLVYRGTMGKPVTRPGAAPVLNDERFEFSRREGKIGALVEWGAAKRKRGEVAVRFFDSDNKMLGESKPTPVDLKELLAVNTSLEHDVSGWEPGLYRIDVLFDGQTAWRAYFRIVE